MDRDDEHPSPQPTLTAPTAPGTGPEYPSPGTKRRRGPRAVPPGVPYHRVLAHEKRRVWRGIAALVLFGGGMLLFSFAFGLLGAFVDLALGRSSVMLGGDEFTPATQASALLGLALLLPWSMLIQRWLYGVRGASLHSVRSLFRADVFGRTLLVILPVWTVYLAVFSAFTPYPETSWLFADLIAMFAVTLLLAPLQSAGEEYGFRGLVFRVAASWGRSARTGLVLGVVVSSLLFMVAHLAFDPWLNLYYFTMGVTLALITWRTGGLEIAVVIHAVNNTLAFLITTITHTDVMEGMDRSMGAGSPVMLVPCVLLVAVTAVVWLRTRRTGPEATPVESAPTPAEQNA
ncbi:CPBP family intramembrane glutamic endopeptidase [Nocardiopsis sp. HUAS JQ3]|uniref:CPBP family intramembrane glutamic endopeptidase n=1 Tax=Nocardiopsis sp. HUAS JQ3 TaxID=3061629 RepID=UPI0023A9B8DE|nr:CPBP family intramembrane glutamic endopeptidase [Nocardiopsis sp. HUAS JQ3]WDZ91293.1 CPBP family intramembrane metalloprotease [Nocardiopsis sp. HUAS JQ3]